MTRDDISIIVTGVTASGKSHMINLIQRLLTENGITATIDYGKEVTKGKFENDDIRQAVSYEGFQMLKSKNVTISEAQAKREMK